MADPILAKCRTDRDDPRPKKSMMLAFAPKRANVPTHDTPDPNLAPFLKLRLEPKEQKSSTDVETPRVMPSTEIELLIRAALRSDAELPRLMKSSTELQLPNLEKFRSDKELPKFTQSVIDSLLPNLA
jgi:hypothetical protein